MNESYLTPAVSGRERVGFPSLESIARQSRQRIKGKETLSVHSSIFFHLCLKLANSRLISVPASQILPNVARSSQHPWQSTFILTSSLQMSVLPPTQPLQVTILPIALARPYKIVVSFSTLICFLVGFKLMAKTGHIF